MRALPLTALKANIVALSRLSFRQRMEQLDLREDRADVILPAALVYARLAELARAETILVPAVGIREGLMIDLVANLFHHKQSQDSQSHLTYDAALALGRRYQFEEAHAVQVCRLALSLFDQLTTLHELGEEERRMLLAAALLHDTGFYISYQRHHKHSQYLITQSELPGFSSQDMQLIGMVARYHRKSEPSDRHVDYSALSAEDRMRVSRLAAIIRIADALDREHLQKVRGIRLEIGPQTVVVHVDCSGDFLLETWGVQKKADLFGREFHRGIRLALEGSS